MLDIAHDDSSQDSRIVKLQEKEAKICKARPIEDRILQNFNQAKSPWKRLGFVSNTARYKRKTLNTFHRFLEILWVTLVRFLLTQQPSTGKKIYIQELVD